MSEGLFQGRLFELRDLSCRHDEPRTKLVWPNRVVRLFVWLPTDFAVTFQYLRVIGCHRLAYPSTKENTPHPVVERVFTGGPGATRTRDLPLRRRMLYPLSYGTSGRRGYCSLERAPRPASALRTAARRVARSKGLAMRGWAAAASSARESTSSGYPDIKITRSSGRSACAWPASSAPFIPGMTTSVSSRCTGSCRDWSRARAAMPFPASRTW